MKNRKVFSLLLAGLLTVSMCTTALASGTEGEIADAKAEKAQAEAGLAQAQANIDSLEGKRQELEGYLAELNAQYDELTNSVAQLGVEAAQKEDELKQIRSDLKKARKALDKQYEAMKIRIAYMYEKGGSSTLELLLSSESFAEFLNRAESVSQISQYDRDMLKKYEELQENIRSQEAAVKQEAASIGTLMSERSAKQQEVQAMAANTNDSIVSYVNQISASEEETGALLAQIDSADNSIAALMQQAEEEKAAAEAEAAQAEAAEAEAAQSEEGVNEDYGYNPDEDTTDSSSSSTSSDVSVEEEAEEDEASGEYSEGEESGEEGADSSEDAGASSDSGQGTFLGNFTLTAYCNCAQCCGTAGNLTASGTVPTAGNTVAMAGVPFGTQLLINGSVYTVEDLGTPYGHVDIYFDSHSDALDFGLQYADVYQVN